MKIKLSENISVLSWSHLLSLLEYGSLLLISCWEELCHKKYISVLIMSGCKLKFKVVIPYFSKSKKS